MILDAIESMIWLGVGLLTYVGMGGVVKVVWKCQMTFNYWFGLNLLLVMCQLSNFV